MGSKVDGRGVGPARYFTSGKYDRIRTNRRIRRITILNLVVSHGPPGGSGRIEDACGESPAASLDRTISLLFHMIIRSLFAHYAN